ncbi:tetratricopeptide repeat protein [Ruminococcus sp.]|uniref:tetratricopeptide repeat protein n=1 Tax=Ruminococcus sp. TaxID=41978 RepID=UPI0025CDBB99|nr:tetratricopeptide repeat protein [Ruminococcus sp.]
MFDFRNNIIALGEQALRSFTRIRLDDLGMTTSWKIGIKRFVDNEYLQHPANYKKLYVYLQSHDEQDLTLEQMDITALTSVIHFYWRSKGIYDVSPDATQLFINHVMDMRELRNTFDHYPQELTERDEEMMYYDQLYFISSIASFSILFMKYKSPSDEWKLIYHNAKSIESRLHGERWLALSTIPEKVLESNEDLSSLIALAEQGHIDAQIKLGKAYYHGDRIKQDREKAHLWIRKAALRGNAEAQYYLGNCFCHGSGVDYDYKAKMKWYMKSAEQGFAPAQYEIGQNLLLNKPLEFMTQQEKDEVYKWIKLSADQEYPEAVWVLSILYALGAGVKQDSKKSDMLKHKASELGYSFATMYLADKFKKNGELEKAIEMYTLAQNQGEKNEGIIRSLKRKIGK